MRRSWGLGLSAALVVVGLGAGCDLFRFPRSCRLGDEHLVHVTTAKEIDAIALASLGGAAFAFWSEPSGAFGRALSGDGKPTAAALRLGERCDGGLAALGVPDARSIALACSTRARGGAPGTMRVLLLDRALHASAVRELAAVGPQSEGVGLARVGGRVEVVWQDGAAELQRVVRAALDAGGALVDAPRALSDPARIAAAPALASHGGRGVVTWSERYMEGDTLHSAVVRWDAAAGRRTLLSHANMAAMPQLVEVGGRLLLAVRDRPPDAKIGLYLAFVDQGAVRDADLVRIGRADGVGRPALTPCMQGLVSATPRTYGGDYFIGFNWFDTELRRARGEQQFYEDSHAFTQVASACLDTHAVLLIAEFPQLHRDSAALRALPYRCE